MIIRQPTTLDIVKIAAILFPGDDELRAELVAQWIQNTHDEASVDLVAVHKKQVVGFIAGRYETSSHLAVTWMKAETPTVLQQLWSKVQQVGTFDSASLVTDDPDVFTALGFEPRCVTMFYTKEKSESV